MNGGLFPLRRPLFPASNAVRPPALTANAGGLARPDMPLPACPQRAKGNAETS